MAMEIRSNHHYQGWIQEEGDIIAEAGFYSDDNVEEAVEVIQGDSNLLLCIGLDIAKEPNRAYGCYDFEEDYARKVAEMVYKMLLMP